MSHPLPLVGNADRDAARRLVDGTCLHYEAGYDDLLGVFDDGRLVGCGARHGRVLKMLVVADTHRGSGLLGTLVGELMRRGRDTGIDGFFIFTRPTTVPIFAALGFRPLANDARAGMLEHGDALSRYLAAQRTAVRDGDNGALIVHADPFSPAERRLAERAAQRVDNLYLFVPAEGAYRLPPPERLDRVRDGVRDLGNVTVIDSGPYLIDPTTFPAYFLDPGDPVDDIRRSLNGALFATRIAPFFGIRTYLASDVHDAADPDPGDVLHPERLQGTGLSRVTLGARFGTATASGRR